MLIAIAALVVGFVAGLRTMTAPAAVSWGAHLGWLPVGGTWAGFMGAAVTPYIFTLLALLEYVADQLPSTPSRKVPMQFGARIVSGAFCGAVVGTAGGALVVGLIAGAVGAVVGTLLGYEARIRLVKATGGRDLPIALLEDAVAIVLGFVAVGALA
ncbi:DUF4126 domain-containing protein [Segnochrobactrum spirostomi]|uniref:DUF4126 domain-containing protein n=1 Tax=Segnochrobactrum spirostomi TaxID=2608987 RepID=A0A6A7Y1M2_9HYPH|nr:DUF4126 domain-containing protein [Segnochrobactrum spirostomi]MQT12843.1 DUF4126 domain-containing protein [Segnochrobactrum spirostomi]